MQPIIGVGVKADVVLVARSSTSRSCAGHSPRNTGEAMAPAANARETRVEVNFMLIKRMAKV